MTQTYDRTDGDVGNVLALEHVNVTVPDQGLASLFYVTALGGTRDPYLDFGLANQWVNVGEQQFHLPAGDAQVFRGEIGLAVPDLDGLRRRLDRLAAQFAGTRYDWRDAGDTIAVTCPWGNRLRCHGPEACPDMPLGIPYLDMQVAGGAANGIGRFYRNVLGARVENAPGTASVRIGRNQVLRFTETDAAPVPYDGHHIAIYIADFSGPHRWLNERGLVTEESGPHQYRFQALADPATGDVLAELEHEVRSVKHPLHGRFLVNRNPAQRISRYHRGRDRFVVP